MAGENRELKWEPPDRRAKKRDVPDSDVGSTVTTQSRKGVIYFWLVLQSKGQIPQLLAQKQKSTGKMQNGRTRPKLRGWEKTARAEGQWKKRTGHEN